MRFSYVCDWKSEGNDCPFTNNSPVTTPEVYRPASTFNKVVWSLKLEDVLPGIDLAYLSGTALSH